MYLNKIKSMTEREIVQYYVKLRAELDSAYENSRDNRDNVTLYSYYEMVNNHCGDFQKYIKEKYGKYPCTLRDEFILNLI